METTRPTKQIDTNGNVFYTVPGYVIHKTCGGYQVEPENGGWFRPVKSLKQAIELTK